MEPEIAELLNRLDTQQVPLAAICAGQMLLDFLGETDAAQAIESAVIKTVREKLKDLAAGKMGHGTREVGDLVAAAV